MNTDWEGCRVSNQLNLWYDEDMHHWTISGREENLHATGSTAEVIRLATAIIENIPESPENGQPLTVEDIYQHLPPPWAGNIEEITFAAQGHSALNPEQRRYLQPVDN